MNPIPLTAQQIRHIDEIQADKRSHEATLKVALNYHANVFNELQKKEIKFWDDLIETHKLDPTVTYTIKEGQVVEKEK